MVDVIELCSEREAAYSRFVDDHPAALISYSLAYRDFLTELLGCRARYAVALRGDDVVGILPLMSIDGALGTVLNSLPYFGSNGGVLAVEPEAHTALLGWYADQARADGVMAATIIANPLASGEPEAAHHAVDLRVAHVTALASGGEPESHIWDSIDSSARRNIKKAQRVGTRVAIENTNFEDLQTLHKRSMDAIGAQVKAPEFFSGVQRHFRPGEDFDVYIGRIDGEPVGALLIFYCGTSVDYYVPAASPDHRSEQPMAAVLLEAMTEAARRGYARWNWGGSWPTHESLQRFKAKWGGVPAEYRYTTTINDERVLDARPDALLAAYPGFFVVPFSALHDG